MKKILVLIPIFLVLVLSAVGYFIYQEVKSTENLPVSGYPSTNTGSQQQATKLTYTNLASYLSTTEMVSKIPEDSPILLRFYNFDTGERTWEKSYVMEKGNVYEGTLENPDLTIILHSKYLNELTTSNFCNVVKKAKTENNFGYETSLGDVELLWKYKGLNDYKDCFGF